MVYLNSNEVSSFKGYRLNEKPIILGRFNPMMLPPFISIFMFQWFPLQLLMSVICVGVFVADMADLTPSEAYRTIVFKILKRQRVISCACPIAIQNKNLERM